MPVLFNTRSAISLLLMRNCIIIDCLTLWLPNRISVCYHLEKRAAQAAHSPPPAPPTPNIFSISGKRIKGTKLYF